MQRRIALPLRFFDDTLSFLFQTCCLLCGDRTDEKGICGLCAQFTELLPPWCECCGMPVAQTIRECGFCLSHHEFRLDGARSVFLLGDAEKHFIYQIKYFRRFELIDFCDEDWFRNLPDSNEKIEAVLPVPLHRYRLKERTFNQSELLARRVAKRYGLPFGKGLEKIKETEPQAHLSLSERRKNLKGAFRWNRRYPIPRSVLLIDDIFTTGATLNACAKVLRRAGAQTIYAWTLFRTPHRS